MQAKKPKPRRVDIKKALSTKEGRNDLVQGASDFLRELSREGAQHLLVVDESTAHAALLQFIDTIESTGGVFVDEEGFVCPRADHEWIDLGEAYLNACSVLNRTPMDGTQQEEEDRDAR